MKIKDVVTNLELSEKLRELKVKQESVFEWWRSTKFGFGLLHCRGEKIVNAELICSAFTAAELGEILMHTSTVATQLYGYGRGYVYLDDGTFEIQFGDNGKSEADARAEMLIHLLVLKGDK